MGIHVPLDVFAVMENYNSVSGVGCDVNNAIPFYHWGALMGLIPLIDSGMI